MSMHEYLAAASVDQRALAHFLDHLDAPTRLREIRSLEKDEQARLFEVAAGARVLRLAHFVPTETPPPRAVAHHGRNSLPIFHDFEKHFCLSERREDELWGYNEHPLKMLTGPGYFIARETSEGEVAFDYADVPPTAPAAWPPILPNSARLGRFLYAQTSDIVRAVSEHVTVGRVTRQGRPLDAWFVLCRSGA